MTVEVSYGILSDVHMNPVFVRRAVSKFKRYGVKKILVNGDIGEEKQNPAESVDHILSVLDALGKSHLEVLLQPGSRQKLNMVEAYIQPGSHETAQLFDYAINVSTARYSNLINAVDERKLVHKDHHIVFLPGSDWTAGGEYTLGTEKRKTGIYVIKNIERKKGRKKFVKTKLLEFNGWKEYNEQKEAGIVHGVMYYTNMNDLKKLVTEPEKTVVLCHIPPRFNTKEGIDLAYFAEREDKSLVPGIALERLIRSKIGENAPFEIVAQVARQNGYTLKLENRGNEDLGRLYHELGITKAVSGHFHETSHRAHNWSGEHVPQNRYVKELFWNAGYLDIGHCGILTVRGEKVQYKNLKLKY